MRHSIFGTQLNRDTNQRQALLKGLAGAIIRSEAIETTEAKGKAAIGLIESLITKAKRARLTDIRLIEQVVPDKALVEKLVHEIAPRFKNRPGGYLRLVKLGNRRGDNAPMIRLEFVPVPIEPEKKKPVKSPKTPAKKQVTK